MPLSPGSTFERYEIESLVGRGGMGEVYRAIDSRLRRPVALKVLRTDRDGMKTTEAAGGVQRLLREARAAAALNHANSVAIYELGEAEGIPYIAM
ncbi:MAG TPA: serine/threonine protein kinase, partial [Labilithrix sp.]